MRTLEYPYDKRPADAEVVMIKPGVYWVRMAIPIPGLDYINLWLLEDGEGWTIVDSGLGIDAVQQSWESIFSRYLNGKPVTRLICTHFHPDHMGLAGWLCQRWDDIPLVTTFAEWSFGRLMQMDMQNPIPDHVWQFYNRTGWAG